MPEKELTLRIGRREFSRQAVVAILSAATITIVDCGGGDSSPSPAPTPPPGGGGGGGGNDVAGGSTSRTSTSRSAQDRKSGSDCRPVVRNGRNADSAAARAAAASGR